MTETSEIADPFSCGGLNSLDFGFAEYAEGDAERAFSTWRIKEERLIHKNGHANTELLSINRTTFYEEVVK